MNRFEKIAKDYYLYTMVIKDLNSRIGLQTPDAYKIFEDGYDIRGYWCREIGAGKYEIDDDGLRYDWTWLNGLNYFWEDDKGKEFNEMMKLCKLLDKRKETITKLGHIKRQLFYAGKSIKK